MSSNFSLAHFNQPTVLVIFGGTGDLATNKLIPALFHLYQNGALPAAWQMVGVSRKGWSHAEFQAYVRECVLRHEPTAAPESLQAFSELALYQSGDFDEVSMYDDLKQLLLQYDETIGQCTSKLYYLAVPPQYYETIFKQLHDTSMMALCDSTTSWSRLLVEKPFGKDLQTALALEQLLCSLFKDDQIYRIDHYLAKDAIENIVSLRFANSIVADSWNRDRIESITIRLLETKDVSARGGFYDGVGTLRDVGQNHLLQILALLTMPPPQDFLAQTMRQARAAALKALCDVIPNQLVRGQYEGFTSTPGVAADSMTETYFKTTFTLTEPDWAGVVVTLEAGKALDRAINEVEIVFKPLSTGPTAAGNESYRNVLRLRFSPTVTISLRMWMKQPAYTFTLAAKELELLNLPAADDYSPEAYERVLFDCIAGDQTRFVSEAEVEAAWRFVTPLLERFLTLPMTTYKPGSNGPIEA